MRAEMLRREGLFAEIEAELAQARERRLKADDAEIRRKCGVPIFRFWDLFLADVPQKRGRSSGSSWTGR
jgi:hypothetical protein